LKVTSKVKQNYSPKAACIVKQMEYLLLSCYNWRWEKHKKEGGIVLVFSSF